MSFVFLHGLKEGASFIRLAADSVTSTDYTPDSYNVLAGVRMVAGPAILFNVF